MIKEIVRKARKEDIPMLIFLLCQVKEIHYDLRPDLFTKDKPKYNEKTLTTIIENENTPIFVYELNDEVLGYAFCKLIKHSEQEHLKAIRSLYINDLCVDEKARGKHIGTKIYGFLQKYAKDNECYNITLNVWASNKPALSFYKKIGMHEQRIYMEEIIQK